MRCCWRPLFVRASVQPLGLWYMWSSWTVHYHSIRFLQLEINGIIFEDRLPLVVNQEIIVVESVSSWMNLKPKSHANIRPWRIAHSSAILLEAKPRHKEKPETLLPEKSRKIPLASANPRLPKELPLVFNFIKGSDGTIHLIILRSSMVIYLAG